jgi:hypothetical protein
MPKMTGRLGLMIGHQKGRAISRSLHLAPLKNKLQACGQQIWLSKTIEFPGEFRGRIVPQRYCAKIDKPIKGINLDRV